MSTPHKLSTFNHSPTHEVPCFFPTIPYNLYPQVISTHPLSGTIQEEFTPTLSSPCHPSGMSTMGASEYSTPFSVLLAAMEPSVAHSKEMMTSQGDGTTKLVRKCSSSELHLLSTTPQGKRQKSNLQNHAPSLHANVPPPSAHTKMSADLVFIPGVVNPNAGGRVSRTAPFHDTPTGDIQHDPPSPPHHDINQPYLACPHVEFTKQPSSPDSRNAIPRNDSLIQAFANSFDNNGTNESYSNISQANQYLPPANNTTSNQEKYFAFEMQAAGDSNLSYPNMGPYNGCTDASFIMTPPLSHTSQTNSQRNSPSEIHKAHSPDSEETLQQLDSNFFANTFPNYIYSVQPNLEGIPFPNSDKKRSRSGSSSSSSLTDSLPHFYDHNPIFKNTTTPFQQQHPFHSERESNYFSSPPHPHMLLQSGFLPSSSWFAGFPFPNEGQLEEQPPTGFDWSNMALYSPTCGSPPESELFLKPTSTSKTAHVLRKRESKKKNAKIKKESVKLKRKEVSSPKKMLGSFISTLKKEDDVNKNISVKMENPRPIKKNEKSVSKGDLIINPEMSPNEQPRRQSHKFPGDLYTPRWVRFSGHRKEGYCDICQPGKWLQLKNSAYWYHMQFFHGISSTSGVHFSSPLESREAENGVIEGLCHQCLKWVPISSGKKKTSVLWFRHAHSCHAYSKPKCRPQF